MFTRVGFRMNHAVICQARVRLNDECSSGPLDFSFNSVDYGELRAVNIESFHRKLQAAREAGCLVEVRT